ncbi:hypothetical protein ACIO3R_28330 [Streptomyces sp. NPDC087428]|uniref:hypothetical protein n=1 Tax=Streptomyces sp. NPDC087428 TaxID=3365788 RepID=UPI003820AF5B
MRRGVAQQRPEPCDEVLIGASGIPDDVDPEPGERELLDPQVGERPHGGGHLVAKESDAARACDQEGAGGKSEINRPTR